MARWDPLLTQKSPRKSVYGSLFQEMRHINFFLGGPKSAVLGGGQKVHVEKVYVLFLSPICVFQYSFTERTVPVPRSVPAKIVPTVPVSRFRFGSWATLSCGTLTTLPGGFPRGTSRCGLDLYRDGRRARAASRQR